MTNKQFDALVKRFGGSVERAGTRGEFIARFPSVWAKDQFEKAYAKLVA